MKEFNYNRVLSIFLWLVSLHSFLVGIGLITMPGLLMESLGYGICNERFFRCQGGVFHIAMAVGYAMAAYNSKRFECLVLFSIIVKFIATIFLFSYYIFIKPLPVIILSGVSDFIMGIVILFLYKLTRSKLQTVPKNDK
jgi:hypothetical protein